MHDPPRSNDAERPRAIVLSASKQKRARYLIATALADVGHFFPKRAAPSE
jgi:hypothetical protein